MSRHLDGFQMYETRTAEEARRRNKYAETQKNHELGAHKELERLHLETMKKERRRLEQELSKIRNKGQYMVKRPPNASNQAVNFTLRQSGSTYASKTNAGLAGTWHGSPNYAKPTGAKRRSSKPEIVPRERRMSRRRASNASSQKQIANGKASTEKTGTPEQQKEAPETDSKESSQSSELSTESPITRVKEANSTPRVHRSSIIIISESDEPTPRKPAKKTKEVSIFDLNIHDARDSVAKRLLSQDEEISEANIATPRTASPKPAVSSTPVVLESVPEEPPKAPPAVPPINTSKTETEEKVKEDSKEEGKVDQDKEKGEENSTEGGTKQDTAGDAPKDPEPSSKTPPPEDEKQPEGAEDDDPTTAENRARDLKRVQEMLENPTQVFDQGKYAPDGGLRTIHLLPDADEAFEEAKKARYLRGKDWAGTETELSINEIFAKDTKKTDENDNKDAPK
ncbi:proteoglycan 4-like [Ptychodera flava]|uniref:proteoglycan 4-like n=1 Tax=Ptychodera flava TaxID=63121 RepID=UPI003969DB72